MTRLTRNDVIKAVGQADDVTIAEIIGTGATAEELTEAQAWIVNNEHGTPADRCRAGEFAS